MQAETLDAPRLRYSLLARALFKATDLTYGRARTIVKFTNLEYIARVPYQAWERVGYLALARYRRRSALARRAFERIVQTRAEQDNEQWHLLILQDLVARRGLKQSLLRHRLAPWLLAFFTTTCPGCCWSSGPSGSYRPNADFEDHAEHEYMAYIAEHPELEAQPDPGAYAAEYGPHRTLASLFRQIGHDERIGVPRSCHTARRRAAAADGIWDEAASRGPSLSAGSTRRSGRGRPIRSVPAAARAASASWASQGACLDSDPTCCPQGYVRVFADEGPPMSALLGWLVAAQKADQAAARSVPARLPGRAADRP